MKSKNKTLLILERSTVALNTEKTDDGFIYLKGIFTEFGVMNRNNRVYEAKDVLPHIKSLQEQIKTGSVMGELDHPTQFDTSLDRVSHTIESLEYDEVNNCIIGKVKILNTPKGEIARKLLEGGVQLSISSRAAGTVDESTGHVRIQKLFTYDLVAEPGFKNAQLTRVNESYGFSNDGNVAMYLMDESTSLINNTNDTENNFLENMPHSNDTAVTKEEFNLYTKHVSESVNTISDDVKTLKEKVDSFESDVKLVKEQLDSKNGDKKDNDGKDDKKDDTKDGKKVEESLINEKVINYAQSIAKDHNALEAVVEGLKKEVAFLKEERESMIAFMNKIVSEVNMHELYSNRLAEAINSANSDNQKLNEQLKSVIAHTDYIVESVNKETESLIGYAEKIAEAHNQNEAYTDHVLRQIDEQLETIHSNHQMLVEKVKENEDYVDHIVEQYNSGVEEHNSLNEEVQKLTQSQDNIVEDIKKHTNYVDHIVEQINAKNGHIVNEHNTIEGITESVDALIADVAKEHKAQEGKTAFVSNLCEEYKVRFANMTDDEKKLVTEKMQGKVGVQEINETFQSCITFKPKTVDYLRDMPEQYKALYEALSDERKQQLALEAQSYQLNNQYAINYFWQTRDLRDNTIILKSLNEKKDAEKTEKTENDDAMYGPSAAMMEAFKRQGFQNGIR